MRTKSVEGGGQMDLRVDVFSDVVCPWCFVGKRRLERAIELLGDEARIEVTWRPFQLNPTMPREGIERREYRARKFGSLAQSEALDARLAAVGRAVGLDFRFDGISRTPNTFDAHRLLRLAHERGVQDAVAEGLFRAYFVEGRDVGDHAVLADVAVGAGLHRDEVVRYLASTEGVAQVADEEAEGRGLGIDGVPFFVVEGKYGISGAQPPEYLAAAFREIIQREDQATAPVAAGVATGAVCPPDDPEACS